MSDGFNQGTIDDPICEICGSNMDEDADQPLRRGLCLGVGIVNAPTMMEAGNGNNSMNMKNAWR